MNTEKYDLQKIKVHSAWLKLIRAYEEVDRRRKEYIYEAAEEMNKLEENKTEKYYV